MRSHTIELAGRKVFDSRDLIALCTGCTSLRGLDRIGTADEIGSVVMEGACADCGARLGAGIRSYRQFPTALVEAHPPMPRREIVVNRLPFEEKCGPECPRGGHVHKAYALPGWHAICDDCAKGEDIKTIGGVTFEICACCGVEGTASNPVTSAQLGAMRAKRERAECGMCRSAPGFCPRHDQAPVVAGMRVEQG